MERISISSENQHTEMREKMKSIKFLLYLFIVFLLISATGCKPGITPKGRAFLKKVSKDVSALAVSIEPVMHTQNISNAVKVIQKWAKETPISTNQYLAIGLLDSTGTDYFSYDFITKEGIVSEDQEGNYSDYKAMKPLFKGHKFSTGTIYWEGIPYGVVCRVVESSGTNCGVAILFINIDTIKDVGITVDQFSNNVL